MSTQLLRNPAQINQIFFSGSQTVTRGDYVKWILDETWAFQVNENVGVSCNHTPFVQLRKGQVFIIAKGAEYVFDKDTVVSLAYPQEETQDIIIENDIYSNNYNTITLEADKQPQAQISLSTTRPEKGDTVKATSNSYVTDSTAGTTLTLEWYVNGSKQSGTGKSINITAGDYGTETTIMLIVKDSNGRKASETKSFRVKEYVAPPPPFTDSTTRSINNVFTGGTLGEPLSYTATRTVSGAGTLSVVVPAMANSGAGSTITLYLYKKGVLLGSSRFDCSQSYAKNYTLEKSFTNMSNGDKFTLKVKAGSNAIKLTGTITMAIEVQPTN